MHDETYPNFKQFLLLVFFYLAFHFTFTFIVIMPKVFGWQILESIRPYFTAVVTPFIYLPFIVYISHKSMIQVTWRMKLPPVQLFLLMVVLAISIRLIIQPFIMPVEYFGNLVEGKFKLLRFTVPEYNSLMALRILILVTIVPFLEEIFWRKQIFGLFLKKYSPVVAMVLSSALFACAHFQTGIIGVIFIFGLLNSFVYYITNSLELSILLHSIVNLSGFFIEHRYVAVNGLRLSDSITLLVISSFIFYLAIQYLLQNRFVNKVDRVDDH